MQTEPAKPDVALVPIWRCRSADCKAWVREELAASPTPDCPLCKGAMIHSYKHLPKLSKKNGARNKQKLVH